MKKGTVTVKIHGQVDYEKLKKACESYARKVVIK